MMKNITKVSNRVKNNNQTLKNSNHENPLVSIVITTYKRSDTLTRAIESVINQTYKPIEVIVADDNNKGDDFRKQTAKIMNHFVRQYEVVYIQHEKNLNGAAARNTAIAKAKGKYITFLDDDDFFMPRRIEQLIEKAKASEFESCLYSGVAFMYNNKIINIKTPMKYDDYVYELLCQNSFFGTGSNFLCVTNSVRKIGGFDDNFTRHQDIEFLIRYIKKYGINNVNDISVVKSVSEWSNVPQPESLKNVKALFLSKFQVLIDEYPEQLKNNIYYENYLELIKSYVFNRKTIDAELQTIIRKHNVIVKLRTRIEFRLHKFYYIKASVKFIRYIYFNLRNMNKIRKVHAELKEIGS